MIKLHSHTGKASLLLLVLNILLISIAAAQSPAREKWEEFKSYDGRFRVLTPGPLTQKVDSMETQVGKLAHHTFFYQPSDEKGDNLLYMLTYYDYPENSIHSDSTELLE